MIPAMTEVTARALAAAEGLSLVPSDNASGYKGLSVLPGQRKPYKAQVKQGGKMRSLGATAASRLRLLPRLHLCLLHRPPLPVQARSRVHTRQL